MTDQHASPSRIRVVLGVGAGAASYKAVALASLMAGEGWDVRAAMTRDAMRFLAPLSFTAVTGNPVLSSSTEVEPEGLASHLRVGEAHAFVIVPATADLIAKVAHGIADDAVTLGAVCAPDLRFFCPAMNDRMWRNPIVQRNTAVLEKAGWHRLGPVVGRLAEGYEEVGRLMEPREILEAVREKLGGRPGGPGGEPPAS